MIFRITLLCVLLQLIPAMAFVSGIGPLASLTKQIVPPQLNEDPNPHCHHTKSKQRHTKRSSESLPYTVKHANYNDDNTFLRMQRDSNNDNTPAVTSRRSFVRLSSSGIATAALLGFFGVKPGYAGEVGARITNVVTTSDLGVSVRRSVVKGAQVIDNLDGRWEKFSGECGLWHKSVVS